MKLSIAVASLMALASASARVYFQETFSEPESLDRWIPSKVRDDYGTIRLATGKWYGDEKAGQGLQLASEARFYAYSAKLDRNFNTKGKDLVLQFTVKYEQIIDCGGAYLKLLPPSHDPAKFDGDSEYAVMFGPDVCGQANRRVHAILNYNGKNYDNKKEILPRTDQLTHQYTFWVKPDQTFEIHIDNKLQANGTLEDFYDALPPREIPDPDAKKPDDWVDEASIIDPSDKKPDDWVDGPARIPDPDAKKPDDWDDDMDGDWEPPMIANPEYKGEWKPRKVPNPAYKGQWVPPNIPNPNYESDEDFGAYVIGYVGLDIWTVKAGTIIDNILVTDDIDYASEFGNTTWANYVKAEIESLEKYEEEEAKSLSEEYDKLKTESDKGKSKGADEEEDVVDELEKDELDEEEEEEEEEEEVEKNVTEAEKEEEAEPEDEDEDELEDEQTEEDEIKDKDDELEDEQTEDEDKPQDEYARDEL
ncbi:hypothetical protein EV182_002790 [Spiromyces aspiralis]|uniref:Uncharacterized protein n=1 Tax=Spiromyces aspiralis TaxID=68401 RepID=A0ACC1HR81_9FUNG|nr:hypothetical protein EV182_002790 [Spiromyces aspiralis]